jgi:hypothetical protein
VTGTTSSWTWWTTMNTSRLQEARRRVRAWGLAVWGAPAFGLELVSCLVCFAAAADCYLRVRACVCLLIASSVWVLSCCWNRC